MSVEVSGSRIIRKMFESPPLSTITNGTLAAPTLDMVPQDATDEDWEEWILDAFEGNSHPLGAHSLPRLPMRVRLVLAKAPW